MAVPAGEAASFEVVDTETGFELAVVVFDAPADLRQSDESFEALRVYPWVIICPVGLVGSRPVRAVPARSELRGV